MSTLEVIITIVGLGMVTLGCRSFFLMPDKEPPLPKWLVEGMRYAPMAALVALIAPDIVMTQGSLTDTWRDPRILGAMGGFAWYMWRRSLLGTIVVGTGLMLLIRFGLGW